jgi:hypothetical protein
MHIFWKPRQQATQMTSYTLDEVYFYSEKRSPIWAPHTNGLSPFCQVWTLVWVWSWGSQSVSVAMALKSWGVPTAAYLLMKVPLMGSTVYGMWSLVCHHLVTASEWSVRYPTLKKTNTGTSTVLL